MSLPVPPAEQDRVRPHSAASKKCPAWQFAMRHRAERVDQRRDFCRPPASSGRSVPARAARSTCAHRSAQGIIGRNVKLANGEVAAWLGDGAIGIDPFRSSSWEEVETGTAERHFHFVIVRINLRVYNS